MSPIDSPVDLAKRTDVRRTGSVSDLASRQSELPPGHPSEPRYDPERGSNGPEFRRLTDEWKSQAEFLSSPTQRIG